jgi:hypothetical protein
VNEPFGHPLHAVEQPTLLGLERPPRCKSLDHLVNVADMIGRRPLVDHHTYTPKVRVPTKQPQGSDEERGLARTQC